MALINQQQTAAPPLRGDAEEHTFRMSARTRARVAALLISAAAGFVSASEPRPLFTPLPSLNTHWGSHGDAINRAGQVAGYGYTTEGGNATLWTGAKPAKLQTPDGLASRALGINDAGHVVGMLLAPIPFGAPLYAVVWRGPALSYLPTLGGSGGAIAYDINNEGHVVGFSPTSGNTAFHATLWIGTTAIDLGTLGGCCSNAFDINDTGLVVGSSRTADGQGHATLWRGATPADLGTLGGRNCVALGSTTKATSSG